MQFYVHVYMCTCTCHCTKAFPNASTHVCAYDCPYMNADLSPYIMHSPINAPVDLFMYRQFRTQACTHAQTHRPLTCPHSHTLHPRHQHAHVYGFCRQMHTYICAHVRSPAFREILPFSSFFSFRKNLTLSSLPHLQP